MFGPIILFPKDQRSSLADGSENAFFALIAFAAQIKVLTLMIILGDVLPTNGKITLRVEESLDGEHWQLVGSAFSVSASGGEEFKIFHTSDDFGANLRVKMSIEEDVATPSNQISAIVEVQASGKPF